MLLEFGYAKVENLYGITAALVRFEPDIVRFQIAVNNSLLMCLMNRGTHLLEDIQGPANRQVVLFVKYLPKRASVEVLHHKIRNLSLAGLGKTEIGHIDHVWVP